MKTMYYLYATLLVCLPIACNKVEELNDIPEQPSAKITYIQANGNEENTKGSVDGSTAAFTWNTGDQIAVYADGYKISDPLGDSYDETPTNVATFAFSGENVVTEESRINFAIYPASLVYDGSGDPYTTDVKATSLKLNLPASYTLAQVQDNVSPTPMIASNAPNGDLAFKALCPLLRISLVGVPKAATEVLFDFDGKKVQGEFTLEAVTPALTAITTTTTAGVDDIIRVTGFTAADWTPTTIINLPVPAGTYHYVTITAKDGSGEVVANHTISIRANDTDWVATRVSSRKRSFSFETIGGLYFATGNLYSDESGALNIAPNHYSNIKMSNDYVLESHTEVNFENHGVKNRSYFSFNELAIMMGRSTPSPTWEEVTSDKENFTTTTKVFSGKKWHVPSTVELLDVVGNNTSVLSRSGATVSAKDEYTNVKFIKVAVMDYKDDKTNLGYSIYDTTEGKYVGNSSFEATDRQLGLLLFPDGVTINIDDKTELDHINSPSEIYEITKATLDELISAKCAFIPLLGRCNKNGMGNVGLTGVYLLSDGYNPTTAYNTNIQTNKLYITDHGTNTKGADQTTVMFAPVRLVR